MLFPGYFQFPLYSSPRIVEASKKKMPNNEGLLYDLYFRFQPPSGCSFGVRASDGRASSILSSGDPTSDWDWMTKDPLGSDPVLPSEDLSED